MATTNLISKSLGTVLTQSGNGVPDHTASKGSLYSNIDTGTVYTNVDGAVAWDPLVGVVYGFGFYQDNVTVTTIGTVNTWVGVANNLTAGDTNGVTTSTNTLVLGAGRTGVYSIIINATIAYVVGTNNYELGISVNNAIPVAGRYSGNMVNATFDRADISVKCIVNLNAGDNIRLAIRNITNNGNVIVRNAQVFLRKIG
jgi:hypothetical protein